MNVQDLAKADHFILRARDFVAPYAVDDFKRMEANGTILRVARGAYVLVPESQREPGTKWRPPIERVALGLAIVAYGADNVALVGPSAARVHGCVPRALPVATVSYPSTRPRDVRTIVGTVRTYRRTIDRMDVVRLSTELIRGLATSIEMTMLDLAGEVPAWPIERSDRAEAVRLLAAHADWELVQEIAAKYRKRTALASLIDFGVDLDSRL